MRRKRLAQVLEVQKANNRIKDCEEVPSWLRREYVCYAFEIGMCDGAPSMGYPDEFVQCDCMRHAYGHDRIPSSGGPGTSPSCAGIGKTVSLAALACTSRGWIHPQVGTTAPASILRSLRGS